MEITCHFCQEDVLTCVLGHFSLPNLEIAPKNATLAHSKVSTVFPHIVGAVHNKSAQLQHFHFRNYPEVRNPPKGYFGRD
jgi:hypothetical protein